MSKPIRFWLAAVPLLLQAGPVLAQSTDVPARNGNIWDGKAHEPDPSVVRRAEQADGIAHSPAMRDKENDEVEQLDRQLQQKAQQDLQGQNSQTTP